MVFLNKNGQPVVCSDEFVNDFTRIYRPLSLAKLIEQLDDDRIIIRIDQADRSMVINDTYRFQYDYQTNQITDPDKYWVN